MAKNDGSKVSKDEMKSVPATKNQRTKSVREARAAKAGKVCRHGGVCNACGQESSSCTTNTSHDSCLGYTKNYDFKDALLNSLAAEYPMLADGTVIKRPIPGRWITQDLFRQRRTERKTEAFRIAKTRVVMVSVLVARSSKLDDLGVEDVNGSGGDLIFSHLDITNGLGEKLSFVGNKFRTEDEVSEYQIAFEQDASAGAEEVANDVAEQDIEVLAA